MPEFQKTGIGSKLIAFSFEKAKELGYKAVLITSDPAYYSRFGFLPASSFDLHLKGNAPEDKAEYFMAAELEKGYLSGCSGIIDFAPEYYDVKEIDTFDKQFAPKQKREAKDTDIT